MLRGKILGFLLAICGSALIALTSLPTANSFVAPSPLSHRRSTLRSTDDGYDGLGEYDPSEAIRPEREVVVGDPQIRLKEKERTYDASPQRPSGANVITLLRKKEPVTDAQMMQKGNRQMFHALMFKTRMGIDMGELRQKVGGKGDDSGSVSDASR